MKIQILKESLSHPTIFGYDFFISFKLGTYKNKGTQSYASDLARCLREKDYLVFYRALLHKPISKGLFHNIIFK